MLKALAGILLIAGVLYSAWAAHSRRRLSRPPQSPDNQNLHALEPRGQGLRFLGLTRNTSGDSSEREADLAKVIPVALTPQHPAWARFRFSTSPLRVQAVQRSILRLSGSSPVSFSRHDKGPWGRAERRACSGCK